MSGYDDQLGQAFFERDHPQQVFAVGLRIGIGPSARDPGPLLALCDSFQLPYGVANKCVACSAGQRHEDDHAAGSVTERGYDYDRAVTVDVPTGRKTKVRAPFEPVFLVPYAGEEFAKNPRHCFS